MIHSLINFLSNEGPHTNALLSKRDAAAEGSSRVVFIILIPILVMLSGVFAGLTLGYMSLDETQLNVLSTSGTEKQKKYAAQIIPIRKNGHLLLITLILANMITNETLPVVSDQVLPGSIYGVIISTALIVIFAEIIPQTVCTRYGLVIGAKMAFTVRCLIILFWPIAFPIAKFLEIILGPHHGIIYRRAELKELIAMHADHPNGNGELKHDTAAIIGHTLDIQEKVVSNAMTPIENVFMLSCDAVLDYATLTKIHQTGHSRIPVYDEIELTGSQKGGKVEKVKRIVGVLLVKQCVLLDPEDATPLRSIPLNKCPAIAFDEPLLKVLDRFQEGRSHIAIVTRLSSQRAASVKEVVKPALTKRFLNRFRDSDSSDEEDLEKGKKLEKKDKPTVVAGIALEQTMPADALLPKANVEKLLQNLDPYTSPLGIITLEDVLEELIGEEIWDEFDLHGAQALPASSYVPPEAQAAVAASSPSSPTATAGTKAKPAALKVPLPKVPSFGGFGILRSRSAPGTPRGSAPAPPPVVTVASPDGAEKLERVKEDKTPSPVSEKDQDAALHDDQKIAAEEDVGLPSGDVMRRSTMELPPVYAAALEPDRNRSISTPSTSPPRLVVSGAATPNPSMTPGGKATTIVQPSPSLLTEAVLGLRQARIASVQGGAGAVTPSDGAATPQLLQGERGRGAALKGRFKSQRLDDAPPSPTHLSPRNATSRTRQVEGVNFPVNEEK